MKKITLFTILILVIALISIVYYQTSLSKSNITSSTVKTPTGMAVEEQKAEIDKEQVIEEKKIIEKTEETKTITTFPDHFLTDVKCIDGKEISFTLNNIVKKSIEPSKLTFYAAGKTIRNPVCDKQSLNPNESADCKLSLNFKFDKIIQFTIAYPAKSQSVNIDCGK